MALKPGVREYIAKWVESSTSIEFARGRVIEPEVVSKLSVGEMVALGVGGAVALGVAVDWATRARRLGGKEVLAVMEDGTGWAGHCGDWHWFGGATVDGKRLDNIVNNVLFREEGRCVVWSEDKEVLSAVLLGASRRAPEHKQGLQGVSDRVRELQEKLDKLLQAQQQPQQPQQAQPQQPQQAQQQPQQPQQAQPQQPQQPQQQPKKDLAQAAQSFLAAWDQEVQILNQLERGDPRLLASLPWALLAHSMRAVEADPRNRGLYTERRQAMKDAMRAGREHVSRDLLAAFDGLAEAVRGQLRAAG
jgi:hypothetical protein